MIVSTNLCAEYCSSFVVIAWVDLLDSLSTNSCGLAKIRVVCCLTAER